ncbi:MAG: hypothetical protein SWK76_05490 [Actinomycetota bacterium]|nr:hypothetical protein [Actinomycetota bacterium]
MNSTHGGKAAGIARKGRERGRTLSGFIEKPAIVFLIAVFTFFLASSLSPADIHWPADGTPVCTADDGQFDSRITSDGSGVAIITWADERGSDSDIYAQRLDSFGATQWADSGVEICTAFYDQRYPQIASDESGGAIITWEDERAADDDIYDIYAQRVDSSGAAEWAADGEILCTASDDQHNPRITSDGANGAIIAWKDYRGGFFDAYAQHINNPSPTVTGAVPDTGTNDGEIDVTITGSSFMKGAEALLFRFGMPAPPPIYAYNVEVQSSTEIACTFDLSGAEVGSWSLAVENPDAQSHEKPGCFEILEQYVGPEPPVEPAKSTTWYLAEGYTCGEFDTWVLVQNPGEEDATVTLDFQLPLGATADPYVFDLPTDTRRSVPLDTLPGLSDTDISTKVSAKKPVVAERTVYFEYDGKSGGHDSVGYTL